MPKVKQLTTVAKILPYLLLIGGIIGALSAGVLTVEKLELAKNPNAQLNCDLNPIVACGSVINTPQASAFGFPNPIIGLIGFGIVATIGAAMLAAGRFKRWFWLSTQAGVTFAIAFVTWLQYQTIFTIGALCPYCMVVWVVTIPMFIYVTLYNLQQGHIKTKGRVKRLADWSQKHHADILVAWYLAIIAVIIYHFWYYWKTVI